MSGAFDDEERGSACRPDQATCTCGMVLTLIRIVPEDRGPIAPPAGCAWQLAVTSAAMARTVRKIAKGCFMGRWTITRQDLAFQLQRFAYGFARFGAFSDERIGRALASAYL